MTQMPKSNKHENKYVVDFQDDEALHHLQKA